MLVTALAKQYMSVSGSCRQVAEYIILYAMSPRYACSTKLNLLSTSDLQFFSNMRSRAAVSKKSAQGATSALHVASRTLTMLSSFFSAWKNDVDVYHNPC